MRATDAANTSIDRADNAIFTGHRQVKAAAVGFAWKYLIILAANIGLAHVQLADLGVAEVIGLAVVIDQAVHALAGGKIANLLAIFAGLARGDADADATLALLAQRAIGQAVAVNAQLEAKIANLLIGLALNVRLACRRSLADMGLAELARSAIAILQTRRASVRTDVTNGTGTVAIGQTRGAHRGTAGLRRPHAAGAGVATVDRASDSVIAVLSRPRFANARAATVAGGAEITVVARCSV